MRRLPPLRSLEAFVRIAKLGSAKAAASELALSPPALSRRIKALEDFMGKPLFERKAQAMILNADGNALLKGNPNPRSRRWQKRSRNYPGRAVSIAFALVYCRYSDHNA